MFLTSFAVSVLLVGSQVSTFSRTKCFDRTRTTAQTPSISYTETQKRIQEFLERDRQTGIELSRDKVEFSKYGGAFAGEKAATIILVRKMQQVKCEGLPANFCAAWDEHRGAWETMAAFLSSNTEMKPTNKYYEKFHEIRQKQRQPLDRQISLTYDAMIDAARKHGVDFQY